ncbi:hypothetical protein BJ878DRAFT_531679 [Calycina marina]|uniref:Extracellular serine-rich protein n=1 Tax=Calycina marina TaxID=1763456 RepID=A0A9P8CJE4_9HELO|nr:hypothetical protein BJ878DRAFT_531679 [Calycina marina]
MVTVVTEEARIRANTSFAIDAEINSTALIIARDTASAYSAYSGLNDHGIPYHVLVVPQSGVALPSLNDSATSALTAAQWTSLFEYQVAFGVRMVRLDVYPSDQSGTKALGDCCNNGNDQIVYISNDTTFLSAGLKVGPTAGISSIGLWHYPALVTNTSIATEFARFATGTGFDTVTTAGVINNINGRQQMVFFLPFATDWNIASTFLQHAWINWATRGLFDDMFLETDLYDPAEQYHIEVADLEEHVTFMESINSKLNSGSEWFIEVGHNGNGNIEAVADSGSGSGKCAPGPIEYLDQIDTPLEFTRPIGSGTSLWPDTATAYGNYSWTTTENLNAFAHVTHNFTHEDQDNATYSDLIPPAITGLHNGDALQAWNDAGLKYAVGDNTRPVLLNSINEHWPLITTVKDNGYSGIQVTPRWATRIYYNCNTPDCTVKEWINTSAGAGTIDDLLILERDTSVRHLLTLHYDGFMFHQANLKFTNSPNYTINGITEQLSLFQAWISTVTQEFVRLVDWPIFCLKHDDLALSFNQRMARDLCQPSLTWDLDTTSNTITGVTMTTRDMTCSQPVPVTFPGTVTNTHGFIIEQVGSDPLTIWVVMSGQPVSFQLSTPIDV